MMIDINLVLASTTIVTALLLMYVFRGYLNQEFHRWIIMSSISMGLWSFLIIILDYTPSGFASGLVLCLFIITPITACICYFIMSYEYATRNKIPRLMYGLFLIPILLFFLGLINPNQIVFSFGSPFADNVGSSIIPGEPTTVRFIINVGLGYLFTSMSVGIILSEIINTEDYNRIYQGVVILASILFICVLSAFRLAGIMPYGIDLSVIAINTVLVLFVLPKTKDKIEEIRIEGSDTQIGDINNPILITDSDENVIDLNEQAEKVLKNSDIGRSDVIYKNELSSTVDGCEKHYKVNSVPVNESDPNGKTMYILSDVSEIKSKIKELEVAQQISSRILRHNVKNKLTPIMGYADMVDSEEYGDKISESAESLAETSNKALELNRYITNSNHIIEVDVDKKVRDVTEKNNHNVSVCSKGVNFNASVPDSIDMILQECIDNSIEHNNRKDIDMKFNVEEKDSDVVIIYTDNGSGIPKNELEVLERLKETELKHSTGCGIWMMKWMIESTGGEFDIWNDDGIVIHMKLEKSSS